MNTRKLYSVGQSLLLLLFAAQFATAQNVVIRNATVLSVTNGTLENTDVLITGGIISEIGTNVRAPRGTREIDATGKFLMPGIVDAHSHIALSSINEGSSPVTAEVSMEDVKAVFETNVFGALRTMQAVLPGMRKRRSGTIVNITSSAGRLVSGGHGIYGSSKYALEAISEGLAIETRKYGLRIIIIEPGFISTPILDKAAKPLDPDGPYVETLSRMQGMYTHARENADPPSVVAEAIAAALDDPEPKLRYIVGAGAKGTVLAREAASDELWIEQGAALTDEEQRVWGEKVFPRQE